MAKLPVGTEKIIEQFGPHKNYVPKDGFKGTSDPDKLVKTHCCFCGMQCGKNFHLMKGDYVLKEFSDIYKITIPID